MSRAIADTRADETCATPLALVERIGRDGALHSRELGPLGPDANVAAPGLWSAYDEHWRRFCGARLDPQFWQLEQPARWTGSVNITDGAPVVIVGIGPSLAPLLPVLKQVRNGIHIWTSARGAEVLAEAGLVPDLVVIEHQTPIDAMFSLADLAHRSTSATARAPLVAASPQTPAALLADVPGERLFVPDPLPTWGLWPATAAAIAIGSGAQSVALVGVDLGTATRPNPAMAPLLTLLELLARHTDVRCLDVGQGGAPKKGWLPATLDRLAGEGSARALTLTARPWITLDARVASASACVQRTAPLAAEARVVLAAACRVRDGDGSAGACSDLHDGFARLLAAGETAHARTDVQDGLGASFLPRYWRTPPDDTLGLLLWRPAALAAHELIQQHRALECRLALKGGVR